METSTGLQIQSPADCDPWRHVVHQARDPAARPDLPRAAVDDLLFLHLTAPHWHRDRCARGPREFRARSRVRPKPECQVFQGRQAVTRLDCDKALEDGEHTAE